VSITELVRAERSATDAVAVGRRVFMAEAAGLQSQAAMLGEPFARAIRLLARTTGRIICCGMGKSGHVARKIAATFASTGAPAFFVHPAEASHGDLGMIGPQDVILALSRSGEARELADLLIYAKRFEIPLIAVTAAPESALGRAADVVLQLADVGEATDKVNAPSTSTTLQMAMGDALAICLLESRGFTATDFRTFHPGGKLGAMLRTTADVMHVGDEVPLVGEAAHMRDALLVMTSKAFGIVGVVDDAGRLVGVITDGDLRRHMVGLLDHTAGEVMTRGPKTIGPHALASEALARMSSPEPAVTVLFVVDADERPIGVIHVHNLLREGVA
jgi:arabinose-5-phosphate isomerase